MKTPNTTYRESKITPRTSPLISLPKLDQNITRLHRTIQKLDAQRNTKSVEVQAHEMTHLFAPKLPFWKRATDVALASLACVLLSPVLLTLAAFIKIVSPGPVFFKQERVGRLGKTFTILKFRSMKVNASTNVHQDHFADLMKSDKPMQKLDKGKDARVIPLGGLIRKSGIDELAQLFNVIRGDMSLVGPRPCLPYEADDYQQWQRARFDVLPGITGLWQVSGKNRTTFKEMIRFDINYARTASFWLDIKIMLKTVPAIIDQMIDTSLPKTENGVGNGQIA